MRGVVRSLHFQESFLRANHDYDLGLALGLSGQLLERIGSLHRTFVRRVSFEKSHYRRNS
jgi:hypothetical protein